VYVAFVNLTAAVERLAVLRDTAAELERANNIVQTRVREGANPLYDGSRIAIALAEARAEVGQTEAEMLQTRGDLDVSIGPYASTLRGLPVFDLYNLPPLPPLASLLETTRTARPDLVAARNRMHSANAQTQVARRSVFQGVVLYAGAGLGANYCDPGNVACAGMPNVGSREVDVTVGMTVPIPVIDRGQGTVPAAEARAVSSARVADALALAAEQRVTAIYRSLVRRREILMEYRDTGVTRTAQMRSQAEAGYLGGRLSVLELVDAYTSYRDARLRLVNLAADARTGEVDLGRATGIAP
jgi:cobalt-zinc-cadmium efflux system outer membrane protein